MIYSEQLKFGGNDNNLRELEGMVNNQELEFLCICMLGRGRSVIAQKFLSDLGFNAAFLAGGLQSINREDTVTKERFIKLVGKIDKVVICLYSDEINDCSTLLNEMACERKSPLVFVDEQDSIASLCTSIKNKFGLE